MNQSELISIILTKQRKIEELQKCVKLLSIVD